MLAVARQEMFDWFHARFILRHGLLLGTVVVRSTVSAQDFGQSRQGHKLNYVYNRLLLAAVLRLRCGLAETRNGGAVAGLTDGVEGRLPDFLIRVFDF